MKVILTTLTTFRTEDTFIECEMGQEGGYPLGLSYIQSYLQSLGHRVKIFDLNIAPYETGKQIIMDKIKSFEPDVIGFSVLTGNQINTFRMIEIIHELYPNIKIILGGIHVTIMYEQIVKKYPYVVAVIGEGEITFSELLQDRSLSSIDGIAYFSDGKVVKTKNRELIKDLDILPFPHHTRITPKHTMANIITSRGCTASCSFCVLNPNSKRTYRTRSAKNVVDEVEYVVKKYPNINLIYFVDDAFLSDNKRVIEICKEIINRKLNYIGYQCQARVKPFSEELIPYLEEANFKLLFFGLETANENMLVSCHKNIKQQDVIDTMRKLRNSKLRISLFVIVGLPGETRETILETAYFIRKVQKIKYVMYYEACFLPLLSVFPGTEVYEIMKSAGKIDDDFWMNTNEVPFFTVEHSVEQLTKFRNELARMVAFMPFSIAKVYDQRGTLLKFIGFIIQQYKDKPLTLIKNFLKG